MAMVSYMYFLVGLFIASSSAAFSSTRSSSSLPLLPITKTLLRRSAVTEEAEEQSSTAGTTSGQTAVDITRELREAAQVVAPKGGDIASRSSNKDFYEALSFAAAAVGQGQLSILFTGVGAAENAIRKLDKVYNVLPEEIERFASTIESVKNTLDCTLEECSIDDDEMFGGNVPPQVLEITQLIAEGEDFIRGLETADKGFVSVIADQLLSGNDCPCSKLTQLSEKIKEAESKLQLFKTVTLVKKRNEQQAVEVRRQMEELQSSIKELSDARQMTLKESEQALRTHELLREKSKRTKMRNVYAVPVRIIRRIFRGKLQPTTVQFEALKDSRVLNELFNGIDQDGDVYLPSSFVTPEYIQQIENSRYPLRVENPIPANEAKRLRVLRDLRLVQLEMEGCPVGNGFEYHRNELVSTVVKLLRDTLPECEAFALQVVGDNDSYTLTGAHTTAPVTPRSQVPCQHVMCLSTSDQAKMHGFVDGYTSDNVLAINLRGKHDKLTKNFCYTPDTLAYVGAAISISDVTIGSLCMASPKSLHELNWNKRKSAFVRKVATVLEEQLTRLCVDWRLYEGELPADWGLLDVDKLLADVHFDTDEP